MLKKSHLKWMPRVRRELAAELQKKIKVVDWVTCITTREAPVWGMSNRRTILTSLSEFANRQWQSVTNWRWDSENPVSTIREGQSSLGS